MRIPRTTALLTAAVVLMVGLVSAAPAVAATPTAGVPSVTALPHMRSYLMSSYAVDASTLPSELVTALHADLGISGAEYLADADADADASDVLQALAAAGVEVTGSQLAGTRLTVNVTSARDAAIVASTGAIASLAKPAAAPKQPADAGFGSSTTLSGGEGVLSPLSDGSGDASLCSAGFNGFNAHGDPQFVLAGHCGKISPITGAYYDTGTTHVYDVNDITDPVRIGTASLSQFKLGGGYDAGLVNYASGIQSPPQVTDWGGGRQQSTSGYLDITGQTAAIVGSAICHSGYRTGWHCGTVKAVDHSVTISESGSSWKINSIITNLCSNQGDSGGPFVEGHYAVGVLSGTAPDENGECTTTDASTNWSSAFPFVSSGGKQSIASQLPGFELGIYLAKPKVTTANGSSLTGKVARNEGGHAKQATGVSVTVDGRYLGTAKTYMNGTFSMHLPSSLGTGSHSYKLAAVKSGAHSRSATTTGSFTVRPFAAAPAPSITGAAKVGHTLKAKPGAWSPAASKYAYQWDVDGKPVSGANSSRFTLTSGRLGHKISVKVTAKKGGYLTTATTSASTSAVTAGALHASRPTITGTAKVGHMLTAHAHSWTSGAKLHYAWFAGSKRIVGATGSTLKLTRSLTGKRITVHVSGTKTGYAARSVASSRTGKVR